MKKMICTTILLGAVSGCSTIQFNNSRDAEESGSSYSQLETINNSPDSSQWHHNIILSLVEITDPVNLNETCDDAVESGSAWETAKTEITFINGLAGFLVNLFLPLNLWTPATVEVGCSDAA